jgi:hypothetical protein
MNPFKSLPAAIVALVLLALLALGMNSLLNGGGPGSATVKAIVEKEVTGRYKGCVIKSITITRGGMFPCQGHLGMAAYGTPIYPVFVKVVYVMPAAADGSGGETREFKRTLFLFKNPAHQWVRDTDLG